jgi:hypothetical protein
MTPEQLDLVAGWAAFVLTLMIFSYLIRDNFLYRIAVHVLVGATAGYIAIAAIVDVIIPWIEATSLTTDTQVDAGVRALGLFPLLIGLMLFLKSSSRLGHIGNFGSLIVLGIGTGVALVGVVLGTIIPLVRDAGTDIHDEAAFNGFLMLTGTITTLIYFQYISRRRQEDGESTAVLPIRLLSLVGQGFISVTLGAIYAGAILTSLSIFSRIINDQLHFLLERIGG